MYISGYVCQASAMICQAMICQAVICQAVICQAVICISGYDMYITCGL